MATKKQRKAKQVSAKLAAAMLQSLSGIHVRPKDIPALADGTLDILNVKQVVRTAKDQRLVALMCPYPDCGEHFPLKKKGDIGSYNIGRYDRHLAEAHNYHRPRPVEVWGF
jgi:hypothetical protein